MKSKNKIIDMILKVSLGSIIGILIFMCQSVYVHIRITEKTNAEILIRQAEFKSEIKENYLRSKTNRKSINKRYSEINEKINCVKIDLGKILSSQTHILKIIDKIYNKGL